MQPQYWFIRFDLEPHFKCMVSVLLEFTDRSELVSAGFSFLVWNPWQHRLLVMGIITYFQVKGEKEGEENSICNVIIFKRDFYKQLHVKAQTY